MSRGNINKDGDKLSGIDKLNDKIAKLLGKRSNSGINNKLPSTSDRRFLLIVLSMIVFLWLLTGIYYLPEKSYGIITRAGKVHAVKSGLLVGIDYPYPFSDITIIDAVINNLSIGKSKGSYTVLSQDNKRLSLSADLSYHIATPERYFKDYYQANRNLDNTFSWLIKGVIQNYAVNHSSADFLNNNTIVIANELRKLSDQELADYGLKIDKFTITSLADSSIKNPSKQAAMHESASVLYAGGASVDAQLDIVATAKKYQLFVLNDTLAIAGEFNQLLPQYLKNKDMVRQLLYYKMLSSIPATESGASDFSLLNLSLTQYKQLLSNKPGAFSVEHESNPRSLNRTVVRERVFKDR